MSEVIVDKKEEFKAKLEQIVKDQGLEVLEDAAMKLIDIMVEVGEAVVEYTDNPYDNMIFASLKSKAEEMLKDLADKIDGEES